MRMECVEGCVRGECDDGGVRGWSVRVEGCEGGGV